MSLVRKVEAKIRIKLFFAECLKEPAVVLKRGFDGSWLPRRPPGPLRFSQTFGLVHIEGPAIFEVLISLRFRDALHSKGKKIVTAEPRERPRRPTG